MDAVDKIRKILAFLQDMGGPAELRSMPVWKAPMMTGDRKGTWSLHVTRNWRITFRIAAPSAIHELNFEDYH